MTKKISASILSADLANLGNDIKKVMEYGADWIHIDVMDYEFVPNLSFGPVLAKSIRNLNQNWHLDIHLMTFNINSLIKDFLDIGVNSISIHPESTYHLDRSISLIKEKKCLAGLALSPATSINHMEYIIEKIDYILIMSVNPGFGGQKFINSILKKIKQIKNYLINIKSDIFIQVDGGINKYNASDIIKAGADNLVVGSAIFNKKDIKKNILDIKYCY